MKHLIASLILTASLVAFPVTAAAKTPEEIRADIQAQINQLAEMVARLQAQLIEVQKQEKAEAKQEGIEAPTGTPAEASVESPKVTESAPPDPNLPAFTVELLKTPAITGGDIVWVPMKDGEPMRQPGWEKNGIKLFSIAEILVNGKTVRTYKNTKLGGEPWAQDSYSFSFPGTTKEFKDSVVLRVTIDGETLAVNIPISK